MDGSEGEDIERWGRRRRVLVRCMRELNKYRRYGSTEALSRLAHISVKVVHAASSIDMSIAINSFRGQVMLRHKLVEALWSRINLCKAIKRVACPIKTKQLVFVLGMLTRFNEIG